MDTKRVASRSPRVGRALEIASQQGVRGLAERLLRELYRRGNLAESGYPLAISDIADPSTVRLRRPDTRPERGTPLTIGWVTTPPGLGSGGHTTMLRMVEALEAAGHTCVIVLYDRHAGDPARHRAVIRQGWPGVKAEVRDISEGFDGLDACVATAWQTAHVLASRCDRPMEFLYLAQDYEPFFYPRGSDYALAEDSYRLGLRCITIGHMVANVLRAELGVEAAVAEFGCDTDVYSLTNTGAREGVVFYAKPGVPRRGYALVVAALAEFHQRHPEQTIHVFGLPAGELPFPAVRHDRLTPAELNELYNRTLAGFAISFTNISLVAEEMLAAGTIPVINDHPYARADLSNPYARWAPPTPSAMARALCEIVESPDAIARAAKAAQEVRKTLWRPAQETVVRVVEEEVYGAIAE
ncbi:hypothetical protein SAMN05444157_1159 [Frankineae bacterium MT45]|nr:hypothetical protein SAMN05444157_1159 [Frankineae bacterium MT45]